MTSLRFKHRHRLLVIFAQALLLGILLATYLILIQVISSKPRVSDFGKFYASTYFFWEGKDIYTPVPIEWYGPVPDAVEITRTELHPNLNPPFQTLIMAPLGLLRYPSAYWVWSALSLLAGGTAVVLIAHRTSPSESRFRVFCLAILLLAYFPTFATIVYGQLSLWLLLLLTIGWISARDGDDRTAGIALGVAISLKPFAGLFLLLFLAQRRWRLLTWMTGTAVICALLALMVFGSATYRHYLNGMSSITWYAASWNASLLGFTTRIFGGSENTPALNEPRLAYGLAYGASLILALMLVWLAWPRQNKIQKSQLDVVFALSIVAMLLISPLGWMYYFSALLIPFVIAWQMTDESRLRYARPIIVIAWILSTVPRQLIPSGEMDGPANWFIWAGCYFYALIILAGILIWLGKRQAKAARAAYTED